MNDQKRLWENLAKKNSRYYINSDYGKEISEDKFRESGKRDYIKYISMDSLISERMTPHTILLDIGCGSGRMTEFMAEDFYETIGIDISREMINQARERLEDITNVKFIESDGENIPLPNESIGMAFSYLVFQHMKTREMVESNFREVYRILKPGGLFKVRVRIDKLDSMESWWSGVYCDEMYPISIGFKLLKREEVGNYGLWLWLEK